MTGFVVHVFLGFVVYVLPTEREVGRVLMKVSYSMSIHVTAMKQM